MRNNFQSNVNGQMLGGGSIEHPLSTHSASIGTRWKPRGMQVLMTLVFLFTLGLGQMWANQTDLIDGVTLPDVPSTSLDMASQTTFTADANGWIVFDAWTQAANLSTLPTWWRQVAKQSQSAAAFTASDFTSTAPFVDRAEGAAFNPSTGKGKSVAIRFKGAEKASFLVHPRSSSESKRMYAAIFSYNGTTQTKVAEKNTTADAFTELLFDGLTTTTEYVAYIYGTASQNACICEIAIKKEVSTTLAAPVITSPTSDPDLQTITQGETKQFSVTTTGYPAPTFKWYRNSSKSTTGATEIEGATAASYTTPNTLSASADNYYFYCVATNSQGSAQSPYFSLKVNELGGDLTAHTPGLYEKAADKGGYGQTLVTKTIDNKERQYEIYGVVKSSGDAWWFAGTKTSNTSDAHCISSAKFNASTPFTPSMIKGAWMKGTIHGTGSNMSSAKEEFPAISSYGPIQLYTAADYVMIKVQGYDQISFYAKDKNSTASNNKHLVVKINGEEQSMSLNTSYSVRRFTLTPSAISIIEISGSTVSDENLLAAFSLRLPEIPDATKYTVGVTGNNPCVTGGESATITLSGSQSGVSYQLYKDNAAVDGKVVAGTGSAISFTGIEVAGTYTVKSVASATYKETAMNGSATVTLAESPVITTQPTASQKVAVNSAVELSVATSTEDVSYQWYSTTDPTNPATEMAGKNAATLNITSAATATTMYYYCVISKSGMCSVESDLAEVITKTGCETEELATSTITGATTDNHSGCSTTIKLQDANGKLNSGAYFEMSLNGGFKAGDIVTVNVKANDYESGKLYMVYGTHSSYSGYQVQNGPTEGNTDDVEFIIPSDMATIGFLRITNTGDEEKEQNHEIKSVKVERETCYCAKPTIGTQPASSAICSGLTVTLTVGNITDGVAPYTYAWYNGDGTAVSGGSGATTASYTTAALAANASYYCVVSTADGCSAQSSTAAITIKPATTITTQPVDADASVGIAQTFSIEANGAGTLEYQWQIKNGENWDDIANADEATYSVSKDAAGAYQFRCIVSGDCGDDVISNVVTLTVSADIYTVTYNANGGTCATPSATWSEGDEALVLPTATKENYDFIGWYDAATGGNKITSPYTPSASIELFAHYMPKLVQAIYSNCFDAFIKNQAVTVYYMEGESAPTLTSIKVLGVETPVFEEADGNIKVTIESVDYIFPVTKTAVAPYTYVNGDPITFDGTETYIKSGYSFSTTAGKEGWRFSKNDKDWSRETPGNNRIYFFIGAAESITLTSGCSSARAMKVYRNGTQIFDGTMPKNSSSPNYVTLTGSNAPAMYAVVSNQTDGDGAIKIMALAPWVSTTGVALKEGEDPISAKSIWESTSFTLTAVVTPDNASNKTITWTSSNDAVATVDNGVVTGVAANATPVTITATTVDGVYAECVVTVTEAPSPCETPTITTQPATQSYCAGGEPTLSVLAEVTDGGTLHYAWFKDDAAFGSDAATCTVDGVGTYKVVVTNKVDGKLDASVTSNEAVITLNVAAAITTQPTNKRDVVSGSPVTLSVVATNATGYQWYICDDAEKHNASAISGAESANYEFACTANGYYYCVVGNACGDDLVSNVVSVKLEPEGCNLVGTSSGNAYTQAGEWSIYPVNSSGQHDPEGTDFGTCKAFDEETDVNCVNTRRFAIKFEKDVESVTIYARGGTGRTFDKVSVADEMAKNAYTELTDITKQLVTIDGAGKEYIATVEGMIPGGKYAWFDFSGSFSGVFKICYTAALVEPKLPTLADQELCAGATYETFDASITNAAACEGTVSYKWFSTADTENPIATTATFTPSAEGTYYVVVTHSATGHITRTVQSANLTVAHFDALAMVSHSDDVFQHMGTEATLSVVATGKNVAYVWYTCDVDGNNAEVISGASTASYVIASVAEGVKYYKVVISHDCDATTLSHVFKVEGWDQLEQVDVTETTTWDMANVSASAINLKNDDPALDKQNVRLLLANIDGVNNNASFNSQALMFEGQHIGRTSNSVKHLAGQYVQFNVTVPGMVSVTFASNGSSQRTIQINGKVCSRTTDDGTYITYNVAVEPGSVVIEDVQGYVRISKIEFKATADYTRPVNPAYLGTLCWTNNAILGGATLYEFAGKNENNYLVFDEVEENRLEAGKPYIFMPENGNTEIKVYNTDNEDALTEDQDPVNNMYGTITGKTLLPSVDDNMYYFSSNHIWAVKDFAVNIPVPAYYCYVDYPAVLAGEPAAAPAPGRRRVTMGVNGKNTPTGIDAINASEQPMKLLINGQIFIFRGEKMFDATGRLVK